MSETPHWTLEEIAAMPEYDGWAVVTDPETGVTEHVRRPIQMLVGPRSPSNVAMPDGSWWVIGLGADGVYYRQRSW